MSTEITESCDKQKTLSNDPGQEKSKKFKISRIKKQKPEKKAKETIEKKSKLHPDLKTAIVIAVLALIICLIVETFNHKGIAQLFKYIASNPLSFIVNYTIYLITLAPVFLFRRRLVYLLLLSALWLAGGVANGVIISSRMTPFSTADLAVFADGFEVLPNYLSTFWIVILALVIILLLGGLVLLFIKCPRSKDSLLRRFGLAVTAVIIAVCGYTGFLQLSMDSGAISNTFSNLANAYSNYGFGYCFLNTWLNTGIQYPNDYSEDEIHRIIEDINANSSKSDVAALENTDVNVIYVQLESFYDPELIKGLELSGDAIPNWHSLQQNYSHGYLTVPVVGAGTANTEFEVLTGMSSHFFGPGEYPYKTILKETTVESAAYILKNYGYGTHAIHNHRGVFYGRNEVYKNLGFDSFTSLEYMQNVETTPKNWAKDSCLTNEVLQALDSTENQNDFVFTVTVQGHGKYPTSPVIENPAVTVESINNEDERYAVEYYVNQLHETDEFIQQLIDEVSSRDEKSVIVFYSDHMPSLGLEAQDIETGNIYETEYLIWDNIGLENEGQNLTSYELSAEVMSRLGIEGGTLCHFHQTCKNTSTYLSDLEMLQYDMLYGNQYVFSGINPYEKTNMRMGIADIKVTNIINTSESWYIVGNNFTPYCQVTIDGEILDTDYINGNILKVNGDINTTDKNKVQISVVEKYKEILSVTELVE